MTTIGSAARGALLALVLSTTAVAQPAPAASPSLAKDMTGAEVGTVVELRGDVALVKTDRHEVELSLASMAPHGDGYVIAMSRAELNAAVDRLPASQAPQSNSVQTAAVDSPR